MSTPEIKREGEGRKESTYAARLEVRRTLYTSIERVLIRYRGQLGMLSNSGAFTTDLRWSGTRRGQRPFYRRRHIRAAVIIESCCAGILNFKTL